MLLLTFLTYSLSHEDFHQLQKRLPSFLFLKRLQSRVPRENWFSSVSKASSQPAWNLTSMRSKTNRSTQDVISTSTQSSQTLKVKTPKSRNCLLISAQHPTQSHPRNWLLDSQTDPKTVWIGSHTFSLLCAQHRPVQPVHPWVQSKNQEKSIEAYPRHSHHRPHYKQQQ